MKRSLLLPSEKKINANEEKKLPINANKEKKVLIIADGEKSTD